MRPPRDTEKVICPASGDHLEPAQVWDSRLPAVPGERLQRVTYGVLPVHKNGFEECPWSGHIVEVVKETALSPAFTEDSDYSLMLCLVASD